MPSVWRVRTLLSRRFRGRQATQTARARKCKSNMLSPHPWVPTGTPTLRSHNSGRLLRRGCSLRSCMPIRNSLKRSDCTTSWRGWVCRNSRNRQCSSGVLLRLDSIERYVYLIFYPFLRTLTLHVASLANPVLFGGWHVPARTPSCQWCWRKHLALAQPIAYELGAFAWRWHGPSTTEPTE
jgi:hypothetical protein